ncbi:MAG: hypothetical protein ACFBWO_04330 [Paracoccaceae bacterium]
MRTVSVLTCLGIAAAGAADAAVFRLDLTATVERVDAVSLEAVELREVSGGGLITIDDTLLTGVGATIPGTASGISYDITFDGIEFVGAFDGADDAFEVLSLVPPSVGLAPDPETFFTLVSAANVDGDPDRQDPFLALTPTGDGTSGTFSSRQLRTLADSSENVMESMPGSYSLSLVPGAVIPVPASGVLFTGLLAGLAFWQRRRAA